jgi:hypothetical protein
VRKEKSFSEGAVGCLGGCGFLCINTPVEYCIAGLSMLQLVLPQVTFSIARCCATVFDLNQATTTSSLSPHGTAE